MGDYQFKNGEIQARWLAFHIEADKKLRAVNAKIPKDLTLRTRNIESIIENLMEEQFEIAKLLAKVEYFYETASSEAIMEAYEKDPKMSTTIIKAKAEGEIANLTALMSYGKFVWQGIERALMSAQSLYKKAP